MLMSGDSLNFWRLDEMIQNRIQYKELENGKQERQILKK